MSNIPAERYNKVDIKHRIYGLTTQPLVGPNLQVLLKIYSVPPPTAPHKQ
jgi:hypothetical protein